MRWNLFFHCSQPHRSGVRSDYLYTFAHCMLYKEGMAASLSMHLVPFITVNDCVHRVEWLYSLTSGEG